MSFYSAGPSPIASSFARILSQTALTDVDHAAYKTHQDRVERSLRGAFEVSKVEPIGSYARGSAIRGRSDLDLLAVIRKESMSWGGSIISSSRLLTNVRAALRKTFPTTELGRDGQAVVVAFADGRSIDVVPGRWEGPISATNGWPLYRIPDGGDGWLLTAPSYHGKYIGDGDDAAGGKLKSVVRILKYWKGSRSPELPLSAFHLELLFAQMGTCNGAKTLASCVADTFVLLDQRGCRALQDPCGISGLIQAAATDAKRERLLTNVRMSSAWAQDAVFKESLGLYAEARKSWDSVFNGSFPR